MPKIIRYQGNLEAPASAALGSERTIFGTGSQSDDLTDQFNAFLLRGWGIVGPSDQPTLQDFNAMAFTLGQLHAYLHQMGVPEYNPDQEYHIGSVASDNGAVYVSLANTNIGFTPSSSPAQWSPLLTAANTADRVVLKGSNSNGSWRVWASGRKDMLLGALALTAPSVTLTLPIALNTLFAANARATVLGGPGAGATVSVEFLSTSQIRVSCSVTCNVMIEVNGDIG